MLIMNRYNPDVLSCLANLSSDEVFTPPQLANQMLDLLPQDLWSNPNARFLDPACKTGVFLREIAKRLDKGLRSKIPDLQTRINHIMKNQLFGIAITELTGLLSRRSLYCSKTANGRYSVCTIFKKPEGNIHYRRIEHTWKKGRCAFCGASQANYDRGPELETHAYEFIHTKKPEEIFNMNFDVIISNPPYQLSDKGGEGYSAIPLYNHFVEKSMQLKPRFLSMIIPARWYSGGKGLDSFRKKILNDKRISIIHDFPETEDCFPGLNIRGGVCYFLWERDYLGECKVYNHIRKKVHIMMRPLYKPGIPIFIRYNKALSIVEKVRSFNEPTMENIVMPRNVFGIPSNFKLYSKAPNNKHSIKLFIGDRSIKKITDRIVYIDAAHIKKNKNLVQNIKVIVSKASPGGDEYPHAIFTKPIIAQQNSVCTETYLVVSVFKTLNEARNMVSYMCTRFFRFLVALIKNTQNISKDCFALVPQINMDIYWTDEKLYKKYGLTKEEVKFIESMIRPMEPNDE